jgi:hypothetical protein
MATEDAQPRLQGEQVTDWGEGISLEQFSQREKAREVFGRVTCIEELAALLYTIGELIDNANRKFMSEFEQGTGPFQNIAAETHLCEAIFDRFTDKIRAIQNIIHTQSVSTLTRLYTDHSDALSEIRGADIEGNIRHTLILCCGEAFLD